MLLKRPVGISSKRKGAEEYKYLIQGSDMVCKVEIMGRKIEVLLDSGLEVSLLKSSVFKGHGVSYSINQTNENKPTIINKSSIFSD